MAELQSQVLNNITLDTKIADADQVKEFVNDSVQELSGKITRYKAGAGLKLEGETFSLSAKIPEKISELTDDLSVITQIGEAQGTADEALLSARAAFENDVALSGALTGWVDGRGYLVPEDVKISYDGEEKRIVLSSRNAVTSVDCGDFVKDGMISDVYYDEGSHTLSILWNSDGGSKTTEINLSGLIDVYTAGEGLTCEDGEFSLTASIPTKMSDLSDDVGYLTEEIEPAFRDLSGTFADKEDLETVSSDITGWVDGQNYLTEHQDINGKANKDEMDIQSGADKAVITLHTGLSVSVVTEHQSLENYYAKSETSSAQEISDALEDKQPSGDYVQVSALDHYSFGDGLSVLDNPLGVIPPNNSLHKIVVDTTEIATRSYVDEGHGYGFQEHFSVTDLQGGGKAVSLSGVALESDVYLKGVFDECLSAVRRYGSPEQVPLSAVVNAIWCLSRLQEWVTPDEPEEEHAG